MSSSLITIYVLTGLMAGISSGLFGIGGGIVIVPALVYFAGFSQMGATGTSLAVLLPPIGLAAVLEYNKNGFVNFPAAIIIAVTLFFSAWITSKFTVKMNQSTLKVVFGLFLVCLGVYTIVSTVFKKV